MKGGISSAILSVVLATAPDTSGAVLLPVCDGITLHDSSGAVYVYTENDTALGVTLDKTEPEGVFRYYEAELAGDNTTETIYQMELSCCEYLLDYDDYASVYDFSVYVPERYNASYNHNVIISDPRFSEAERTEYHFYIKAHTGNKSSCTFLNSNEYITEDGIAVIQQYVLITYTENITGDADADGKITINDASVILECYASVSVGMEPDGNQVAADVNGSGKADISDASAVLSYYAASAADMNPQWSDYLS